MKRRLTQVVGSVVLTGSVLFGASTTQAQNWTFTDVSPQVRCVNSTMEPKEFDQYRNGGSAYKYGFRRGFYESRYGYRKASLESYSTSRWYQW